MSVATPVTEYEDEPIRGLPGLLPEGEEILWQGAPSWRGLARRVFHLRKLGLYFGALGAWRVGSAVAAGAPAAETAVSVVGLALLAATAVAVLAGIAWLQARTTVYTVTNRRVVVRFGVALPMAVNFPFAIVRSAALRTYGDGTGDIPLEVSGVERLGFAMLWPHARPWRFGKQAQPMLRCVPDAASVAAVLVRAASMPALLPVGAAAEEDPDVRPASLPVAAA